MVIFCLVIISFTFQNGYPHSVEHYYSVGRAGPPRPGRVGTGDVAVILGSMSNAENVCPVRARGVARALRALAARPPAGVKLQLRDDDLTDVHALIDGPADTPYCGGTFRVRLALGRGFPAQPPRAHFLTKLFHPNVAWESGEVCVNTLARDWRPELGLAHALLALRCLLIAPNPDSALNAEAAALLRDRYDDYFQRAKLLTDIHARPHSSPAPGKRARSPSPAPARKDKRRILKRL